MSTLLKLDPTPLADAGTLQAVGGNSPFLLDDPAAVWIIRTGHVEVFSVGLEDGRPAGSRKHFMSAGPGDALFGMDLARLSDNLGLLAVGVMGTTLSRVPIDTVKHWTRNPETQHVAGPLVERWAAALSTASSRLVVPRPRADHALDPGHRVGIPAGLRVRARRGVVWVRQIEGQSLFIGMEDLSILPPGALLPLTGDSWLQTLDDVVLETVDTATALGDDGVWPGLEAFYQALLACEFFNTRLAAADELNRLREKALRDRRAHSAALGSLAALLQTRPLAAEDEAVDDPLLAACRAVGRHLGLEFQAPPKTLVDEPSRDPLADILRASRVRAREVTLKGSWWRADAGPLLGFLQPDGQPLAILPRGRGYEIYNPAEGRRFKATADSVQALGSRAYTFYRRLPDRALTPFDLLAFAAERHRRDLLLPMAMGLCMGLLGVVSPFFTGVLIDTVLPQAERAPLVQLAMILAVVGLATGLLNLVRSFAILRVEIKMGSEMQPAMWDRLLGLPAGFFRKYPAGDLAGRVGAIDAIRRTMSDTTTSAIMTGLFSIFLFLQLFFFDLRLALVAAGLTVVSVAITAAAAVAKLRLVRESMAVGGRISGIVLHVLSGIAKLRVTGSEGRAFGEWAREFSQQKALELRSGRIDTLMDVFHAVFPVVCSIALFYTMSAARGTGGLGDALTPGEFIAFNAAFAMFLGQMLGVAEAGLAALSILPLYERARPILETLPEVDRNKIDPGEISGQLAVSHVSFRYGEDGPAILNDVSLEIAAGEFVAIVGPSGSGKSTLLRLLLGLETPTTGSIYYDGRDLAFLDVQKLRRKIGVVIQNGKIRAGSIYENIVGTQPISHADALEACRMVGFEEDLKQMPMGLHTMLQQGGGTLSGGQRQRLMIARAIVTRPRLIYFDEATSALDNRTQAVVSETLQAMQATRIAIAHRLSTIINANRIYVMDRGRIVQAGTYEELVAQPGLFSELVKRQIA